MFAALQEPLFRFGVVADVQLGPWSFEGLMALLAWHLFLIASCYY